MGQNTRFIQAKIGLTLSNFARGAGKNPVKFARISTLSRCRVEGHPAVFSGSHRPDRDGWLGTHPTGINRLDYQRQAIGWVFIMVPEGRMDDSLFDLRFAKQVS
jgi:hypothetical protein